MCGEEFYQSRLVFFSFLLFPKNSCWDTRTCMWLSATISLDDCGPPQWKCSSFVMQISYPSNTMWAFLYFCLMNNIYWEYICMNVAGRCHATQHEECTHHLKYTLLQLKKHFHRVPKPQSLGQEQILFLYTKKNGQRGNMVEVWARIPNLSQVQNNF